PFSITELLHSIQVMFAAKAKKKGLQFICTADTAISYAVNGDPMRLTQVLVNLIGNAIKFTEKGGVYVSCSVETEDEETANILFSIRDTGIGIPAGKTETIFERFTQADTNITRKYGGTGLGLAITKQLIELQGGSITLKSNDLMGAEFLFTLPYHKSADNVHTPFNKELVQHLQFDGVKRILIVEDNLMNQKLAAVILEGNGFDITIAENGKRAVDILGTQAFDLILMDMQMPIMDGYEATRIIRNDLHIGIPIIAMTAHALAGEKEKCIQAGMNDYLSKPFKEDDLLVKIARWSNGSIEANQEAKQFIDLSFLLKQTRNNRSFILDMITIFKQQNPKDITALKEAIGKNDYPVVYKITHTIRNTIGFFGLDRFISHELLNMEKLAKSGNGMEEISSLFSGVETVCRQAVDELETLDTSLLL
ncbi:MAG: response regulator, partial [Ferruginibacter sp.]|nr:response regulator [Chitinophagaceae bacterium]